MAHIRDSCLGTGVDLRWLRSHPHLPLPQRNSGRVILKHIQITGFCLPDWGYRGQSAFWSDGLRGRPQEDLHRNLFVVKIALLLYFVGVLFSGIKTNTFLFVFARLLTGLSVGGEFTAIFTAVD